MSVAQSHLSNSDAWDEHWSDFNSFAEISPGKLYRDRLVSDLVKNFHKPSDTLMDFGAGQGDLIRVLKPILQGSRIVGLEMSQVGIDMARRKTPEAEFHQINLQDDLSALPELRGMGTLCTCSEVIEHLDEPRRFLENISRFMAPGGRLIVTVPGGPMNAFYKVIGHRQHFTDRSIAALLESGGLKVLNVYRAGFPFFNLFRLLATARGDKAMNDVQGPPSPLVRIVMEVFHLLFALNTEDSPWGWQLVVVAQKPE